MSLRSLRDRSLRTIALYSQLPRDVQVLAAARFISGLGRFVYPFLALLLTQRMGMTPAQAGTFVFFAAISSVPGALVGGRLADRLGRKRVLVATQFAAAATILPGALLVHSTVVAYLIIGANFFNSAAQPAVSALVVDRTNPDNRQVAFSFLYLGFNAGYAVGPLLAGFLFEHFAPLLFIGDAVTTLCAALLAAAVVKESKPEAEDMDRAAELNPDERPEEGGLTGVLLRRPQLLMFVVASLLLNFVYAQTGFTLPLQLQGVFGGRGPVYFGAVMTINALTVVFLTPPLVAFTRRFKPLRNMQAVAVLYATGFGMLFFAHQIWYFVLSVFIWSIGEVINATNASVYLANHTPSSHRGRMNGFRHVLWAAGRAINAPIVGVLIEYHPISSAWLLAFLLACGGGVLLLVLGGLESRRAGARRDHVSSRA